MAHIKQVTDEQTGVRVCTAGKWALVPRYIDMYTFKDMNLVFSERLLAQIKTGNTVVMSAAAVWFPLRRGLRFS